MLKNLFAERHSQASAPEGLRIYAVGDIHGCSALLDDLMAAIRADEKGAAVETRLIFLGDYVDRGPDSAGVLDRLIDIGGERPDTVFLMGNHEAAFLDFLDDPEHLDEWLDWGGVETLESYDVRDPWKRAPAELADEFLAKAPAAHLQFLKALELSHTLGDYFFVHAGVRPGRALDEQDEDDLLWIRSDFHNAGPKERPDHVIVHGHQPTRKPVDAGWRIGVDTGACFSGALTAVVLEGDGRRFLST